MMIGIILTSLTIMNIIPRNDFTSNIFQIGSLFEITLLSMALAYRYKLKQEDIIQKNLIIQKQSKLASMGEMLQNISHQWRQPLSEINAVMMKIYADFYTKKLTATTLESDIEHIELVTQHMSETIEIFNNYFQKNNKKSFLSLEEIIYQAIRIIDGELKDVRVKIDIKENVKLMINSGHLIQVLHIIIINAVDAFYNTNSKYKKIYISLKTIDKKQIIEIEDNAGGIDTKIIEKIFEPYFTTKFQSNGIGIGLYMAKMLVEDSLSGNITVSNTKEGAKFKIEL
jgi:C4-dicarboxylate-specific signal transduction histidine kinase